MFSWFRCHYRWSTYWFILDSVMVASQVHQLGSSRLKMCKLSLDLPLESTSSALLLKWIYPKEPSLFLASWNGNLKLIFLHSITLMPLNESYIVIHLSGVWGAGWDSYPCKKQRWCFRFILNSKHHFQFHIYIRIVRDLTNHITVSHSYQYNISLENMVHVGKGNGQSIHVLPLEGGVEKCGQFNPQLREIWVIPLPQKQSYLVGGRV